MSALRVYYKDAVTEQRRSTRGRFDGWERGGSFGFWYARFVRPKSMLWVPKWSIEKDSLAKLPALPKAVIR